jgi:hypothetical protein
MMKNSSNKFKLEFFFAVWETTYTARVRGRDDHGIKSSLLVENNRKSAIIREY